MIRRPPRSTLFLHDALPISSPASGCNNPTTCFRATLLPVPEYPMMTTVSWSGTVRVKPASTGFAPKLLRSEEHTSELQSRLHLVCRLLLEKKKNTTSTQQQL